MAGTIVVGYDDGEGAHGESPIRGALLGSTAHKLLHLADRPVLVVPAE